MTATGMPEHGIWVVDKPSGPTSHDVVAQARRFLGTRRVGHAGTLDPLATGVLVLLLGEATKLSDVATREDKTYRAELRFGRGTSSHDVLGETVEERALEPGWLNVERLEAALEVERRRTLQEPPAVSAIKIGGQRSYALARNGAAPALAPRAVEVRSIALQQHQPAADGRDSATIELRVSKGYYVRALARDLGLTLGAPAHLTSLRRLSSGHFAVEEACAWPPHGVPAVLSLRAALPRLLPTRQLTLRGAERARQGKTLVADDFSAGAEPPPDGVIAWTDAAGNPVALGRRSGDVYRVQRGFAADQHGSDSAGDLEQAADLSPV
ncbi:MAG TPA: tRNA pseudouridine(55) synthase TruB [Polyangiaceae bacterium]|nr:tRNA pseudouridine(55) synthase TruB [Polyangiaceae bacterium]